MVRACRWACSPWRMTCLFWAWKVVKSESVSVNEAEEFPGREEGGEDVE